MHTLAAIEHSEQRNLPDYVAVIEHSEQRHLPDCVLLW